MNTPVYPVFADTVYINSVQISNTSITDITTVNATKDMSIYDILIVNLDTAARTVTIYIDNGTTTSKLCTVSLVASAGNAGNAAPLSLRFSLITQFIFSSVDGTGSRVLNIPKGYKLKASIDATSAGYVVHVFGSIYPQVS